MKYYKITENNVTYDVYEAPNGYKAWYKNGKRHRENGPACEYADGSIEYWYNGNYLYKIKSDKELIRYIKLLSIY